MPEVTHKSALATEMLARLYLKFQGKPKIEGMINALAVSFQELEDQAQALRLLRQIDTAQGAQLDVIGRVVGILRGGRTDDAYRAIIRAWIAALRSTGTVPDLGRVIVAVVGTEPTWFIRPVIPPADPFPNPARIFVEMLEDVTAEDGAALELLLRQAKAAGVALDLLYSEDVSEAFTFSVDDTEITDTLLGFADSDTPTSGGFFMTEVEI